MTTLPVWLVALALAACAPVVVRAAAERLVRRHRERTYAFLARLPQGRAEAPTSPVEPAVAPTHAVVERGEPDA
jgi:hypothetical protein